MHRQEDDSNGEEEEESGEESASSSNSFDSSSSQDLPPVYILLLPFMFMFQGYGCMVGSPLHALKEKLDISGSESAAFQDATASFQLAKLVMRVAQIAFLVFVQPNGIVYLAYAVMLVALLAPLIVIWGLGVTDLWVVYLQYILGGLAVGFFEGTFLSVISSLGKDTKTFAIMGAPLGFAVCNIVLGTFLHWGMPSFFYYVYAAFCIPVAVGIFRRFAPAGEAKGEGKGCQVFLSSVRQINRWGPKMLPWLLAKFVGNFVLEDGFPLLINTFNTRYVPLWNPESHSGIPFDFYTAWLFFPMMALGDSVSRRVPQYITLSSWRVCIACLIFAVFLCVFGLALDFLLVGAVTAIAAFVSNFGNGFIYGLSAKYIDGHIAEEHRYAAYNLWCLCGDLGGYAGQSSLSVSLAKQACAGKSYMYVCHHSAAR